MSTQIEAHGVFSASPIEEPGADDSPRKESYTQPGDSPRQPGDKPIRPVERAGKQEIGYKPEQYDEEELKDDSQEPEGDDIENPNERED